MGPQNVIDVDARSASPRDPVGRACRPAAAQRLGLALVLVVYLALAGWYTVAIPVWEAPDESEHVQYVHYVARARTFPRALPTVQLSSNDESHQMPFYYALGALVASWADPDRLDEIRRNPYVTWPNHPARFAIVAHSPTAESWPFQGAVRLTIVLRLFSVLLGSVVVASTYLLVLRLLPESPRFALLASAAVAFLPGFLAASARVNNDALLVPLASLVALAVLPRASHASFRWRESLGLAGLLALTVAAKMSGVLLVATAVLSRLRPRRDLLLEAAVLGTPALAVALAWTAIRGASGELIGVLDWSTARPVSLDEFLATLANLVRTFVGAFGGWQSPFPDVWYVLPVTLSLPALGAALLRYPDRALVARLAAWPALLLLATVGRWALVAGGQGGFDHGRFLYPALAPLAALLALGWVALPRPIGPLLARLLPLVLLATSLAAPPLVIEPAYAYRAVIADFVSTRPDRPVLALDQPVTPGLRLIGLAMQPECPKPGDAVLLWLYWRAEPGGRAGVWTSVYLRGQSWPLTRLSERDPGRGLYPSSVWLPGEVVRDDHQLWLGADLPPGDYRLETGIAPEQGGRPGAAPVSIAHLRLGAGGPGPCLAPAEPARGSR